MHVNKTFSALMGMTLFLFLQVGCDELMDGGIENKEENDTAWIQHPFVEPENRITEIVWEGMYEDGKETVYTFEYDEKSSMTRMTMDAGLGEEIQVSSFEIFGDTLIVVNTQGYTYHIKGNKDENTAYLSEENPPENWYKLIKYNSDGTLAEIYGEGESGLPVTWDENHNMLSIFNTVNITYSDKPNIWCGVSINAFYLYGTPGFLVINDSFFRWHTANIPASYESGGVTISLTVFTDNAGRITSGYLKGGWRDGERFRIGYGGNPPADYPEIEGGSNDPEPVPSYTAIAGDAIDLGLSVKWMSCNLGATRPEEYGDYFAWGETEPKNEFTWDNYKFGSSFTGPFSKYNASSDSGPVDNKTVLEKEDDVARLALGGNWRMPTDEEWDELITTCTWEWVSENEVGGIRVTGPNRNSIFIPAAGSIKENELYKEGVGCYWSSSLDTDSTYSDSGGGVSFAAGWFDLETRGRYRGQPIRPVSE